MTTRISPNGAAERERKAALELEVKGERKHWASEIRRLKRNGKSAHDAQKKVATAAIAALPNLTSVDNCLRFVALVNALRMTQLVETKEANSLIYGAQTFIVGTQRTADAPAQKSA